MKPRWILLSIAILVGLFFLLRSKSPGPESHQKDSGGKAAGNASAQGSANPARHSSRDASATPEAEDREAKLKDLLRKKLQGKQADENERLDECRKVLAQLGRVADFHEVLAILDELAGPTSSDRSTLIYAVFENSRQSVAELATIAKSMRDEDRIAGIVGISEKMRFEEISYADLGTIHQLASDSRGAQAFSVVLDFDLAIQPDPAAKQKRLHQLNELAASLPEDQRDSFQVSLAGAARKEMPVLAWELLSGSENSTDDPDAAREKTLALMLDKDPATTMSTLLRGSPTAVNELETSFLGWLAKDPEAAKEWYQESSPMLNGDQANRLGKIMTGTGDGPGE